METPIVDRSQQRPTNSATNLQVCPGNALPFGASLVPGGVNFSIHSYYATSCTLVLFEKNSLLPMTEIPIPTEFCIGSVFAIKVLGLDYEKIEYGFRLDGPHAPEQGHYFDPKAIVLDPYATAVGGRDVWGSAIDFTNPYQHRARIVNDPFDWGADRPLGTPIEDLIIYEMHIRGFTRHASSGVQHPGTYDGLIEKIPYLKELGVNCVELMPILNLTSSRTLGQTRKQVNCCSTTGATAR